MPTDPLIAAVDQALRAIDAHAVRSSECGWRVALGNGIPVNARARVVDQEWLELTTSAPKALDASRAWWSMLRLNGHLRESVRLARWLHNGTELRAEVFLTAASEDDTVEAGSLEARIAALCDALVHAYGAARSADRDTWVDAVGADPAVADTTHLVALCAEVGWHATSHESGDVAVSLDGRTGSAQALLSLTADARLRAVAPLTAGPVTSEASRAAVALLLLSVSASIRGVTGVVLGEADTERAGLAAACEHPIHTSGALGRILGALSIACDLTAREVQALEAESVALDYLTLRHPSWRPVHPLVTSTPQQEEPCLLQPF